MNTPRFLSSIYHFIFSSKVMSPVWLAVRVYVGYQWLHAGYGKFTNPAWIGADTGKAIIGFVNGALGKTVGEHPDVTMWYAWFLKNIVLPNAETWSYAITFGEMLVGAGLILGALTFLAGFFGVVMNFNFLLAGTVSINPVLLLLTIFIMLAYRVAGYIGLDYYILKTGRY